MVAREALRLREVELPVAAVSRPELEHPFQLIVFDWDGTAVASRHADATRVATLLDALLGIGARAAIVTGTKLDHVARQLDDHIRRDNRRRLYVATNRGSEVFAFDRRGEPFLLWGRHATDEEERLLDAVAEEVVARLERLTGLSFRIVYDRLNRRKIDLIPEPEWADPPKSAIGALLGATEARLRGRGLRGGLREAFELTERVARELGLRDARVTSDVKHIEVGLTDKADSMEVIFHEIAEPLRIAASDILILGDEFGPIGGFEGSDTKMLGSARAHGAIVVSVGPEPGGAPPGVIHLGGGPERFVQILDQQLSLEERLGPFAAPRDASWVIGESGFDLAREHEIESLLSIANGYLGSRGSLAEGTSVSRPATFLAGAFEPSNDVAQVPELVILPDWGRIRIRIEGEPLHVESGAMTHHRRVLDMRRGLLLREGVASMPDGHVTGLRTVHIASMATRHLLLEGVELTPLNYSGTVRVDAILSGEVKSASGAAHWASFETRLADDGPMLVGRTSRGLEAVVASRMRTAVNDVVADAAREATATTASERYALDVRIGDPCELHRATSIYTSRDVPDPVAAAARLRADVGGRPFQELIDEHTRAWDDLWRRAGIEIDGAPRLERALRFALYHLLASANPDDSRTSIGARALAGEAYRGHVFWDTEIFMTPFYTYTWPEAARAQLMYRHRTLEGARRKAKAQGYEGALYPWESADSGDEATPSYVVTPFGELLRVLSGEQEHHISADVAYAIWQYVRATGDRDFMREAGVEILVETARFWASRVTIEDGVAHIYEVIGPDEYHEAVHDNAFTNWMARHNLLVAVEAVARYGAPEGLLREGELERFRDVAARIPLGLDSATGIIEQFSGFHRLEYIDLASFEPRTAPMDVLLGRARTQGSQVVKQADVVQLLALLWDELPSDVRYKNFLYYEPRTAHGSSLSPGIHALVAARLDLQEIASRYLDITAHIDLDNTMGNAAGGVHAAGMGSLWQAVVLGVAGVRQPPGDDRVLAIEPHLLPGMRHLGIPLTLHGTRLELHVEPRVIEVSAEGGEPIVLRLAGSQGAHEIQAEPGRTYVSRREEDGYGPWERRGA